MSIYLMADVWRIDFPAPDKIVALKLADHARDDGSNIFPSLRHLVVACSLSRRRVQVALANLIKAGILIEVERANPRTRTPTIYRIDIEQLHLRAGTGASRAPHADDAPDALPAPHAQNVGEGVHDVRPKGASPAPRTIKIITKEEPSESRSAIDDEFERWWSQVPQKIGRGQAERAYRTARKKATPDVLLEGIMRYAAERTRQNPIYTKHPATWLNGKCWLDAPAPPRNSGRTSGRTLLDALKDL